MSRSRTGPWSNRLGPVAAVATRPPTVPRRAGSTPSRCPDPARSAWRSSRRLPAPTTTIRSPAACSTTLSMRLVSSTRSTRSGLAPHVSLVPEPRTTTARSWCVATRITAAVCSVVPGQATQRAGIRSTASASVAATAWSSVAAQRFSRMTSPIRRPRRCPRLSVDGRPCGGRGPHHTGAGWERPCRGWRSMMGRRRSAPAASCRGRRR